MTTEHIIPPEKVKAVLVETADRLEAGKLAWTKDAYLSIKDDPTNHIKRKAMYEDLIQAMYEDLIRGPLSQEKIANCAVCAMGACTLVADEMGLFSRKQMDDLLLFSDWERSLDAAVESDDPESDDPFSTTSDILIRFNDSKATTPADVAVKLREVAEKIEA